MAMMLPIRDPGFKTRKVGGNYSEPIHVPERAELNPSNQQPSVPPEKFGGKLKDFLSKWESITDDPW